MTEFETLNFFRAIYPNTFLIIHYKVRLLLFLKPLSKAPEEEKTANKILTIITR